MGLSLLIPCQCGFVGRLGNFEITFRDDAFLIEGLLFLEQRKGVVAGGFQTLEIPLGAYDTRLLVLHIRPRGG